MNEPERTPYQAKIAEARRRLIGHTILLECLAERVFEEAELSGPEDGSHEKVREALRGATAGARHIREILSSAQSMLPTEAGEVPMNESLGLILGLILENSDEVPETVRSTAENIAEDYGFDTEILEP